MSILMSSHRLQLLMYQRSELNALLHHVDRGRLSSRNPWIWAQPVMPGLT
jgi:hypothetical protein